MSFAYDLLKRILSSIHCPRGWIRGSHLDVKYATVAPAVLVVANQRPRLVRRQRRLARACQALSRSDSGSMLA